MKNGSKRKMRVVGDSNYWNPETEGEVLDGVLTDQRIEQTKYGLKPVIDLTDPATGETKTVHSSKARTKVLNRIPKDSFVSITFLGTKRVKGRKTMMDDFKVETDAPKLVEDWTGGKYYVKDKKGGAKKAKK